MARKLGADKLVTYTLPSESGHSLMASGWRATYQGRGGSWNRPSRGREDKASTEAKVRWEKGLTKSQRRQVTLRAESFEAMGEAAGEE